MNVNTETATAPSAASAELTLPQPDAEASAVRNIAAGGLVVPDGAVLTYGASRLKGGTSAELDQLSQEFARCAANFERFYDTANTGKLLDSVLTAANSRSFIDQAMCRVSEDAAFKNGMVRLFSGAHTDWSSMRAYLGWATLYTDVFTSTPIPANLELVAEGQASLGAIRGILDHHRELFDGCKRGVLAGAIAGNCAVAAGIKVSLLVDGKPIDPRMVSGDSATIQVGDHVYYNGLPMDRSGFPTFVVPEGSRITLKFENTTTDRMSIVPTINGIPLTVDHLIMSMDRFNRSALPIADVDPHSYSLKPSESVEITHFHCNSSGIERERGGSLSRSDGWLNQVQYGTDVVRLSALAHRAFERTLSADDRELLARMDDGFRQRVMVESACAFTKQFIAYLAQPRKTEIVVRAPIIADGAQSSELSNPLVGSIGVSVIRLEAPPIKAKHTYSFDNERGGNAFTMGGGAKKGGAAGLSMIGGRADLAAVRMESSLLSDSEMVHRFIGYASFNLMSTMQEKNG